MTRHVRLICVWAGVAVTAWLIPASVHIVDWPSSGPVRVAFFAPLWQLWIALAVAGIAAIATGVRHRGKTATVSDTVIITPLLLLWLWALPYLPWLPDRAPALLALAGPLRWGVAGLAIGGTAWMAFAARSRPGRAIPLPGRRTVFALSLALYLFFGLWSAAEVGPGADEPHYLVITQSLIRDHDLAIENNHTRGDYREYFGGELRPDFLRRGLNEVIYSIHAPGLPALLIPAYALAGYSGAVVMLCLFGSLAALAIFDLAARLAGRDAAWITWAAVCLTVPFVPHSWLIFPEMPGTLVTAWAALWLFAPLPDRPRTWIWRGLALALLPWLHTKFVILLAVLGAALFLRVWRTPKAAGALVTPVAVSLTLWIYSFHRLYGVLDPQVPYGDFPKLYVLAANIPRGVLGLLFDQKFGLLAYAPVYVVAIAGGWMMLRRPDRRLPTVAVLATVGAFVASSTRMYMWWGGSSAPARFLVPVLPLVAPMIAVAFQELRSAAWRATAALLLIVSLAVAASGVSEPHRFLLFSAPHGLANMAAAAEGGSPLSYLLPTFTEGAVGAPLALLAPWAAAAFLALLVVWLASRLTGRPAGLTAGFAGLATFVAGGSLLAGAPALAEQRHATAFRGRLDLMRAYDGPSLRAFDYTERVPLNERHLFDLGAVKASRADGTLTADPRRLAGPFELPAGRFTARLSFSGAPPHDGAASVLLGEGMPIARRGLDGATRLEFDLPVDATVWVAVTDAQSAILAQQLDLVADSIVPRSARPDVRVHAVEAIEERPGAYIVYGDRDTYPEGGVFWTRGTRAGTVLISPAGAAILALTLHVGPAGGAVRVLVDGHDHSVTMAPDQTQQIDIPITTAGRLIPVTVKAPGRFRPSDTEAGSTDRRWLGSQVRIGLR